MSTSMEASTSTSKIKLKRKTYISKYFIQMKYISNCFNKDFQESIKEIGNHFSEDVWMISYKEIQINNGIYIISCSTDSESVPTALLEHHYQLVQEKEEAEAWLRMWANSVDSNEDFEAGLPGYDGNIQCPHAKEIHNKLKESPTFDSLLVRYGVYQLLEGN